MTEQMEWFKFRIRWLDVMASLTPDEVKAEILALRAFYRGTEQPELTHAANILWLMIGGDLEKDQTKREKAAEAHRKVGIAAGLERAQRAQMLRTAENAPAAGNAPKEPVQASGTAENAPAAAKESAKPVQASPAAGNTPAPSSFVRPTLEEIRARCREKRYRAVPEAFLLYYDIRDWKTGTGVPLKNWRDALDMWEIREKSWYKPQPAAQPLPARQYSQRNYDEPEETLEEMMLRLNGGVLPVATG